MRHTKTQRQAVSALREMVRISQQELAARVGRSLSAVHFWGTDSPPAGSPTPPTDGDLPRRGIPEPLFTCSASEPAPTPEPPKAKAPDQAKWQRCYLDPNLLNSLSAEIRELQSETKENIL